jgi:hypothetical protein
MKILPAIVAIGAVSLGFASSAFAFSFQPIATRFAATGQMTFTANGTTLNCSAKLVGKTNTTGFAGRIISAKFNDGTGACNAIAATGLPWKVVPTSAGALRVEMMSLFTPSGVCGPDRLPATLSGSAISFNHTLVPGNCQISGALTVSPTMTIAP